MAVQSDSGGKDDVKTQFVTREGTYRLMTLSEYSRPNRVGYTSGAGSSQVRVSLVTLPPAATAAPAAAAPPDPHHSDDRICFNHGKELYVYVYRGCKKAADLTKPVDKKMYKGTNPTCHDFNTVTLTPDSAALLVGFSTGQVQLIDPIKKELSKLYNEERLIDKTRVTCIRWVPGSSNLFVAAHASGQLYVYNEELPCPAQPPHYQLFKQGAHYSIHTCRARSTRNPLYRWVVGAGPDGSAINEFAFSPCGTMLAVASQDGLLRVFHYDTMESVGLARSYFGGFLCVCWSPDGRYVVVGGEDDLVTVWSVAARRVVARGQGHRSWVSVVAFDPYVTSDGGDDDDADGERAPCYRLGSVAQDTQLCLWDLTEDVLKPPPRSRASAHLSPALSPNGAAPQPPDEPATAPPAKGVKGGARLAAKHAELAVPEPAPAKTKAKANSVAALGGARGKDDQPSGVNSLTQRLAGFSFGERRGEQRRAALGKEAARARGGPPAGDAADPLRLIGTPACPRFDECPVLEPLVCKKIAHERLTALLFRSEYFVTACADGCVNTWARPLPQRHHNGDARRSERPERPDRTDRPAAGRE